MNKLLLTFIIGMFLLSFTSAWTSVDFTLDQTKPQSKMKHYAQLNYLIGV